MGNAHTMQADHAEMDWEIVDPGDGNTIDTSGSGVCLLTSGASGETRLCGDPEYLGQWMTIVVQTDGGGDIDITFDSQINSSGNTIAALDDVDDQLDLISIKEGTALQWRIVSNRGSVSLS